MNINYVNCFTVVSLSNAIIIIKQKLKSNIWVFLKLMLNAGAGGKVLIIEVASSELLWKC